MVPPESARRALQLRQKTLAWDKTARFERRCLVFEIEAFSPKVRALEMALRWCCAATDLGHRAADLVDKILKRAKPGEIPIFQPIHFELSINLKTKTIGIELPPLLVARADNVIE
jgi:hypothetical protein